MSQSNPLSAGPSASSLEPRGRFRWSGLPSWLISLALHLALMLGLGIALGAAKRQGAAPVRTADVGIALKQSQGPTQYYHAPDAQGATEQSAASGPTDAAAALDALLSDRPPMDPSAALPAMHTAPGLGALEGGQVGSAQGAAAGHGSGGRGVGGIGRTQVFGIPGEGYKFVYVFDRSGSMGGFGGSPLNAAKAELLASLASLEQTHQFQIIFYNDRPAKFNPTGDPDRLVFANERNKALAERFVRSITAEGGTRHEEALLAAIKLQPDVVFFLTDADEPKLWPDQLARINRLAAGITIHAIEFGYGPQSDSDNFLVRLARQNGGQHAYVDVSRLPPAGR